ncbi:hypothetical protein ILYODFUR_001561 [Ilyodon furcidens]|uniref:Uncharacterized protein n=1 Tax=Ilyodon furcidens TaxID=33524 RepID=A0ABV0UCH8_9TELE
MASISRGTTSVFFLLLIMAFLPACTGTPGEGMFMLRHEASGFLHRTRRANSFLEELRLGNLERECYEEKCSFEEAREIIPQSQQLENFWRTYTAVDHCLSSPCKNGATCTRHYNTYICKCAAGFHGSKCDKGRNISH